MKKGFVIQLERQYISYNLDDDMDRVSWNDNIEDATIFNKEDLEDFFNQLPEKIEDYGLSDFKVHEVEVGTVILNTFSVKPTLIKKEIK
jgi:hypothetical protein